MSDFDKQILIMKFGGTSVGSIAALQQSAKIVGEHHQNWANIVVVVSAMRGITNQLIECTEASIRRDQKTFESSYNEITSRHIEAVNELLGKGNEFEKLQSELNQHFDSLASYYSGVQIMGEVSPRGMDAIVSFGERLNARIFSALLRKNGIDSQPIDATELIVTNDFYQSASPKMEQTRIKTKEKLDPLLNEGTVPIVTGFIGATEDGIVTTMGRGGSDYTASILGASLDAAEVWTWTDVDGVMTADPRIVSEARVIPQLSYNEVSEMAYFGAKVLHPKTLRPLIEKGIPVRVKNTFNPSTKGTYISTESNAKGGQVTTVTAIQGLSLIAVEGRGMLGVPGIAARTFSAVARQGASVLMISQSSSEQSICFVIPSVSSKEVVEVIEEEMALELNRRDIDRVWSQQGMVIVTVIGAGMRHYPGVSAAVFGALGRANINVIAIAQGSSEYSFSMVLDEKDVNNAIQQIHLEVIEKDTV